MRKLSSLLLILILGLTLHCSRKTITREQWMKESEEQRLLVVRSMLGGEHAEDAKGGRGSRYSGTAESYRTIIDAKYARGDRRSVSEIWSDLNDRPGRDH